ncbi:hypothetical protein EsH8_II_000250 [Colletotrichum jinshuiense]
MSTPTLAEKLDKIRSPGLQSQKRTVVVLQAVDATLKEQNTQPTPTGYFAALLALLTQAVESGNIISDTTTSVVYLLDTVTPFAPQPLLRAKFTQILTSLAPVLLQEDAEALLLRSSIGCLESLLVAQDSAAWELGVTQIGPRRAVAGLLNLALDHRPKIRKRAQEALRTVLRNAPPSPSIDHPAADMCAHTALANLEDIAGKAEQARKQKSGAESAHDPALIHALQLIKTIASSSGGWPSKKIESLCELLLGISRSGNEYMTMSTFEIFEMIFEGMADEVASAKLPRLMEIISELRPAAHDTQLIPPWLAILSRGYDVSAQVEPEDVFQNLPEIFSMVAQYLESPAHNIRISASECLVSFMVNCVPKQVILEPSIYDEKTLDKIAKIAESLLSVKYQQAWMESFNVFGAMFDSLRWRAHPMMLNITKAVGDLRGSDSFQGKKEADEVIGKAVRAMGPEAVLSILPLNIAKPVKGQQGRAWMFPILRDYVSNTNLAHFRQEMVPLSELMFQRVLDHGKAEKTMEVKIFETLVQQIWATLPGYCDLPLDVTETFDQTFAELLANILYKQVELRLEVCRALKTLIESNQAIATIEDDGEEDLVLQSRVSKATAKKNLAHLGSFAGNMLAVLFNVYTQTLPQSRGPILLTINAFLSVTPEKELIDTFDRVSKMLAAELQQAAEEQQKPKQQQKPKDQMPSTSNTLMDLIITIAVYLPRESYTALFEIATVIIFKENEPQLQKKAYKLVPRLAESETGKLALEARSDELQQMFLTSADKVSAPARRERLGALSALLPFIPDTSLHFIPSILSEVVIGCKENNERAREAAYDLLVQIGHRMESANGAPIDNTKVPHMPDDAPAGKANIEEFLTMVSAGLVGSTPHMISASITALSRVLYEFRRSFSTETLADLVQTMDLFLTSNNREIVKSVLGFVKICVLSLPSELVIPRLSTLIPNLIIWGHEHKGHFKSKVRHILERMVRKFGFELVSQNCPEGDRKLIVNIRKTKERSKKKKDAARQAGEESDEEDPRQGRKFDNELDQALYSSESEGSDDESDDEGAAAGPKGKRGNRKGGNTYIVEDEDEPLDLLDRNALANISSTKPVRMRKPTKTRARTDLDGKLILGKDDDGAMEIDGAENGESGVGAYVAALKGKDVAKRGLRGKLKFSNKRGQDDDEMEDMDEGDAAAVKAQVDRSRGADRSFRGGRGGPARGGRGGRDGPGGRGGFGGRDGRDGPGGRGGFGGRGGRGGPGGRGGRGGRGGIASGRKGLGEDRRRGGPVSSGGVNKGGRGGRGARR